MRRDSTLPATEKTEDGKALDAMKANPIGQFVDPDKVVADHAEGVDFEEIHAKAMAGGYAPEQAPVEIPEAEVADQEPAWAV